MAPAKVLVIGAGVAGPPLAALLKLKGYDVVFFERTNGPSQLGLGLGVAPNGMAALSKIPGLMDELRAVGRSVEIFCNASVLPEDPGVLSEFPASPGPKAAPAPLVVRRYTLIKMFSAFAEKLGAQFRWDHNLESIEQTEDGVKARFTNGAEEEGSFLVGCDGLHSNVRKALFGAEEATFTGLFSVGGLSPVPEELKKQGTKLLNVFGHEAHVIACQVEDNVIFWSATRRGLEEKETWKAMDAADVEDFKKNSTFASWDFFVGELVKTGYNLTKFGLYDRPELKSWHKGRVVLVGDAAHPTSPHLGQGANQSFEDIALLAELLEKHNPSAEAPSTTLLEKIFSEFETARIPATSEIVKGARVVGNTRVVSGVQACIDRNNAYREMVKDPEGVRRRMMKAGASASAN